MSNIDSKNLVAQANALIKARYKATRNEEVLLKSMMSLIHPSDENFLTFTTSASDLATLLGMDKKSAIREFDKITTRLMTKILKIESGDGDWIKFQWVSKASLKNGILSLRFHDELKPYLLALRETGHFTQYRLEDVLWFKSAYTNRIYEMLIEANNKKQKVINCTYFDFRERMLGEKSKAYPVFGAFRRKVIDVAQKELSKLNDNGLYRSKLNFDLVTHRTGRKITDLEFRIIKQETSKCKNSIDLKTSESTFEIEEKLISYGLSKKNIESFLATKEEKYLLEKIEYLEAENKKSEIKNKGAWLTKAISEDWKNEASINAKKEEEKREKEREAATQKRVIEKLESQRRNAEIQVKNEFLASLSNSDKDDLLEKMKQDPENGALVDKIDSGIARAMLSKYIPDFYVKVESLV